MPKRAWCNGCRSYVMLTADDLCPYGHTKPSLRAVEELGYGAPPTQPERRPPTDNAQYESQGFTPASATASTPYAGGTAYYGGDRPAPDSGTGYNGGYGYGAQPTSSNSPSDPFSGHGAPAPPAAAMAAPMGAWQPAPALAGHPWQSDGSAAGIDPMLQVQLDQDKTRMYRDVPWTESWVGIIVFLLILWPLGMVFLWRSPIPTTTQKWAVTGVYGALIAFNIIRMMLIFSAATATMPVAHP